MKRKRGTPLLLGGLLCLTAALCLCLWNLWEQDRAARASSAAEERLTQQLPEPKEPPEDQGPDPDRPMPVVEVDGMEYIGLLEIPKVDLSLPVLSQWSEEALETAPCRYQGSLYKGDLIIAGHNYRAHFGYFRQLAQGDPVYFTDGDGVKYTFVVDRLETVAGTDFEGMESGEWDLTLFTCTWGGRSRLAVRCLAVEDGETSAPGES